MVGSLSTVFHSTAVTVTVDVLLFLAAVAWLGWAFWTHRDAKRRLDDPILIWAATALGLVPVAGPLVYLLFRPPETLPRLPGLHDPAQGALPGLWSASRAALAGLPLLRRPARHAGSCRSRRRPERRGGPERQ
jgi:hypothetical protein